MNTKNFLSFDLYTCKELKALCKEFGLKGYSRLLKAQLVQMLNKHTKRADYGVSHFEQLCVTNNLMPKREKPVTEKSVKGSGETVKEMQAYLKSAGVKGFWKLRKAELQVLVAKTKAIKTAEAKIKAAGCFA